MFGFLRGNRADRIYRQVYAGCCSFQQREYGIASLAFLSYEATFLYLLAVDSGAAPAPKEDDVTCCRLRRQGTDIHSVEEDQARFCSSLALLLAAVKLDDDIADDKSLLARLARWKLGSRIDAAVAYLESLSPAIRERIDRHLADHSELERKGSALEMADYVRPTANAFGDLFELFQSQVLGEEGLDFRSIGEAIGAAIICFDCAVDWRSDRKRGRFNPLTSQATVLRAMTECQRHLSHAGWLCRRQFGDDSHAARTIGYVFAQVSHRMHALEHPRPRRSWIGGWTRHAKQLRAGFCDCDCPCGDIPCCEADGVCCDFDGTDCGSTGCFCCDCCIAPFESTKKKKVGDFKNVVGKVGVAAGNLDPEGVVIIGRDRYPAKSAEGTIEDLVSVEVIAQDAFGVTVKRASLGAKKGGI